VGIDFVAQNHDGANGTPYGVSLLAPSQQIRLEDCRVARYFVNVRIQGDHRDLALRRCVIVDAFTKGNGHAQGIYLEGVQGCVIEECVIDHNGWRQDAAGCDATVFRHNVYVQGNCRDVILRGNIIARASSHGVQLRCGGTVEDNLFVQNPIGLLIGTHITQFGGGWRARVSGNVFLDGRDIEEQLPRGWGVELVRVGAVSLERNVFAWNQSGRDAWAIRLDATRAPGIQRVVVHGNVVCDWGGGLRVDGERIGALELTGNIFQDQRPASPLVMHEPGVRLRSQRNIYYSAAPPDQWMQPGRPASFGDWATLVGDQGSRVERLELVPTPAGLLEPGSAKPWPEALGAVIQGARDSSRGTALATASGTDICRAVRRVFGINDE
jgi:hypothetical protein